MYSIVPHIETPCVPLNLFPIIVFLSFHIFALISEVMFNYKTSFRHMLYGHINLLLSIIDHISEVVNTYK